MEFYDLSALYRLFNSLYMYRAYRGRKGEYKSDTERHGIPTQPPWFFYVPGVQLRYTGSPFYVPIRRTMINTMDLYKYKMRTMINTMDIYNEKMNDMWESAPGI